MTSGDPMSCVECGRRGTTHVTATGRTLCDDCYRSLAQITGAVFGVASGQDAAGAVGVGLATGGFAGAADAEVDAIRRRRAKLEATTGCWRRLWVRVIG